MNAHQRGHQEASERLLHEYVRAQLQRALGGRSWKWLSARSGVPQSTLSNQVGRPRFTLGVLLRVAAALEYPLGFFFLSADPEAPAVNVPCTDPYSESARPITSIRTEDL
jgi:hypothetical protein